MKPRLLRYRKMILGLLALPLFFCLICPAPNAMNIVETKASKTCPATHPESKSAPHQPSPYCNQTQPVAFSKAAPADFKPIHLTWADLAGPIFPEGRKSSSSLTAVHKALSPIQKQDLYLLNRSLLL